MSVILVYPRGFYLDQLERKRPAGLLLEESALQVRVEITRPDLELLRYDASVRSSVEDEPNDHIRLLAKGTLSRIRAATAEVKVSKWTEDGL